MFERDIQTLNATGGRASRDTATTHLYPSQLYTAAAAAAACFGDLASLISSLGKTYTSKYNFVCTTATKDFIGSIIDVLLPGLVMDYNIWPGPCSDGEFGLLLAASPCVHHGTGCLCGYGQQHPAA